MKNKLPNGLPIYREIPTVKIPDHVLDLVADRILLVLKDMDKKDSDDETQADKPTTD